MVYGIIFSFMIYLRVTIKIFGKVLRLDVLEMQLYDINLEHIQESKKHKNH